MTLILGVTLDDELSFSSHISDICKKASKKVGVLVRLRNMIPMKAKLQLHKSAILPNLTYCHLVWHFCKAFDVRKLERVQERVYVQYIMTGMLRMRNSRRREDSPVLRTDVYKTY